MPRNRIAALIAAAALAGGGAGAAVTTAFDNGSPRDAATTTVVQTASNVANAGLSVGDIAKLATKSVVEVDATTTGSGSPFP